MWHDLLAHGLPKILRQITPEGSCHLVGGSLRDHVLELPIDDFDVIVAGDGLEVARRVIGARGGRLVDMGRDRFAAVRIVGRLDTLDIWGRGEQPLRDDLERRDLTIHSFAVDVHSGEVIDPFAGIADLRHRVLRATSDASFWTDPLRILRLSRFASRLPRFEVEERSLGLAKDAVDGLKGVASERLRQELELIFSQQQIVPALSVLAATCAWPRLWIDLGVASWSESAPEEPLMGSFEHLRVSMRQLDGTIDQVLAHYAALLQALEVAFGLDGPDLIAETRAAGLLAKRHAVELRRIAKWHCLPSSPAEQRWFLHQHGHRWQTAACIVASRQLSDAAPDEVAEVLTSLSRRAQRSGDELFNLQPLVSGRDLKECLGLVDGPRLGRILDQLHRLQIEGSIKTREEALKRGRSLREAQDRESAT